MLLMKKRFFEAIRAGHKTMTVRLWRHARLGAGQVHTVPGLGKVRIVSVQEVALGDLSEEHARCDGFDNLAQLKLTLQEMYPDLMAQTSDRRLYAVRFTFPA